MAIYHLSVKTISRSSGRSATAAIAYRSGEKVACERTGLVHDYTRRRGVEHTEIFTPENAPKWASNRGELWNAAELAEKRKNSTVAREFEVALPDELNREQRLELVREFSRELVQRHGMAVDVAIHTPGKEGDHRNHHAHILCSTRRLTPEGFKEKTRELDTKNSGEVGHWRERWAEISNRHLENAGRQERIDHRTLEAQRFEAIDRGDTDQAAKLDRVPTVHLGPNVVQMEKRGIQTERGDKGRDIAELNAQIINLAEVRQRIERVREKHERNNETRSGRNREATRGSGVETARSDTHKAGTDHTNKPNIVSPGRVPPTIARGRLWNLSELRLVRFTERGEVLLSRDVSRDMEHQRTQSNNPVRRTYDGLDSSVIKREWEEEKDRQFSSISKRAKTLHSKAEGQFERQKDRMRIHDNQHPVEPSGLFSNISGSVLTTWREVKSGLEKRWVQLQNRIRFIGDFMRKSAPHEPPTRGEILAETKAAQANPELAVTYSRVIESEKAARSSNEKIQHQPGLDSMQKDKDLNAEQKYDLNQVNKQQADSLAKELNAGTDQGDKTKDARKRELLERFKEKASRDRDNDRGRGY